MDAREIVLLASLPVPLVPEMILLMDGYSESVRRSRSAARLAIARALYQIADEENPMAVHGVALSSAVDAVGNLGALMRCSDPDDERPAIESALRRLRESHQELSIYIDEEMER